MTSQLITNEPPNTLINRLSNLIDSYNAKVDLCVISGFFNAKALQEIARFHHKLNSLTIILGKDSPSTNDSSIAFYLRHGDGIANYELDIIQNQLDEISATKIAYDFIAHHANTKIYTSPRSTLIHSKMYFLHDCANPKIEQNAIIGSSNLTASGLGLYGDSSNKELNLLCDSKETTKECKIYFDNLLNTCIDSTQEVLNLLNTSYFYHSPKDIIDKITPYFKDETQDLSANEMRDLELGAKAYELYDFQKSATQECLKRLKTYGVALLADPVGSGKTLSALALATLYKRIAIISPAKLKAQWESYKYDSQDVFIQNQNITFYSYDEAIHKDKKSGFLQNADLVIIDESHSFRNDNATYRRFKERLGEKSHILLLSATPINNSYLDLARQLSLNKSYITINKKDLDPIKICEQANKATKNAQDSSQSSEIILPPDYYKLCNLIFSRSAQEIESFLKAQGKYLPTKDITSKPRSSIPAHIDFSIDSLLEILGVNPSKNSLSFCIYDPYSERYLPREIIELLKSDKLANLGDYSTPRGFLCMSLIKALESSVDAFSSILDKIISYHTRFLSGNFSESSDDFDESSAFPQRLQSIRDSNYTSDLSDEFYSDIKSDLDKLQHIKSKLDSYNSKRDFPKSEKFLALKNLIDSCDIKREKLIIFTESIITAEALKSALQATFSEFVIESITGNTSTKDFSDFKKRFSPKSLHHKLGENEREIDILVATDCLSEGQNLQDCANLLNWDIAFNPVRAIQRIGRIWRIGSKHKLNRIRHFFPMELEKYIDLEAKLRYKLEAANTATALENPFSPQQEKYSAHKELRQKQLKAMESEFIALEPESNAFVNLSNLFDFTAPPPSNLLDGIFSIARICHTNHSEVSQNLLFALLADIDSRDKTALYPCIYDISRATLLPSVSENDKYANLSKIITLKNITQKPQEDFTHLESLTKDYRDISVLKHIFANLTNQLNAQIDSTQKQISQNALRDGGLFPKTPKPKPFKLIAWLLINPNFTTLQGQSNAR